MQRSVLAACYRHLILLCGALLLVGACQSGPSAPPAATISGIPTLRQAQGEPQGGATAASPTTAAPQPTTVPTTVPQPSAAYNRTTADRRGAGSTAQRRA